MPPIRILLIDPYPLFRDGVSRILDGEPGFSVAGSAATIAEGRQLVRELLPDVLIFEWNLPDGSGLTLLRDLERDGARARTVLLTTGIGREDMALALMAGLSGLVLKQSATPLLFKCLRSVIAGEYWLGHDRLPDLVESMRQFAGMRTSAPRETLTPREIHVIAGVVAGSTNRDISSQLGMSEQTVKNHLSHIFDKVGVSNRLELALFAIHHRLVERTT